MVIALIYSIIGLRATDAQQRQITLKETIDGAIANSNLLKMNKARVNEAMSKYDQAKDQSMPTGAVGATYSYAQIPANHINLGSIDWVLPKSAEAYVGGASLNEIIFSGFKLKYARESTNLLAEITQLEALKNKDLVIYTAIQMYFDLYKTVQTQKVISQNMAAIDSLVKQAQQFYEHGIVTQNDILRFKLQLSETAIMAADLEANRKIISYNIVVLLGMPEGTDLMPDTVNLSGDHPGTLQQYRDEAFGNRQELKQSTLQARIDKDFIRSTKADMLPKLSANVGLNYIHAGADFIPSAGSFIAPISVGATVSWNFSSLWFNKNKVSEAHIRQQETFIEKNTISDEIRTEVSGAYQNYLRTSNKVMLLQVSIDEARENDRMQSDRYRGNVASVTDRLDAATRLYGALTNMELARADAMLAWYTLMKATGKIAQIN